MGAAVFGGVYLGSLPSGSKLPHRFGFNTIADNLQLGIACSSGDQTIDACLLVNDSGGEVSNCTLAATTKSSTRVPSGKAGDGFSTDNRTKDGAQHDQSLPFDGHPAGFRRAGTSSRIRLASCRPTVLPRSPTSTASCGPTGRPTTAEPTSTGPAVTEPATSRQAAGRTNPCTLLQ